MDSSSSRIYAPFFSSAFSWNFALGMTQLLIPLYARDLGYSGVAIGSLILLAAFWRDRKEAQRARLPKQQPVPAHAATRRDR